MLDVEPRFEDAPRSILRPCASVRVPGFQLTAKDVVVDPLQDLLSVFRVFVVRDKIERLVELFERDVWRLQLFD